MNRKILLLSIVVFFEIAILILLLVELDNGYEFASLPKFIPFFRNSNNPLLHSELIPNYYGFFEGFLCKLPRTVIKINSDGFRDREFSIEKPNNTIRIVALGDSFTFGWGVNISDTWPKILEELLNEELNTTKNFEVMNLGVSGYNTLEEVELFKIKGLKYQPDIVIVGYVGGDAQNNSLLSIYSKIVVKNYSTELKKFKTEEERQVFISDKVIELINEDMKKNFERNFEEIVVKPLRELKEMAKNNNFRVIILILGDLEEKLKLEKISEELGFSIVDSSQTLDKYPLSERILCEKDHHPNKFAHRLIAITLFKHLINFQWFRSLL